MSTALRGAAHGTLGGPLAPALLVSIALHAALLIGLPDLRTAADPPPPPPLMAWLAPAAPPAEAPEAAPVAAPEQPAAAPVRPRRVAPATRPPPVQAAPNPEPPVPAPAAPPRVAETTAPESIVVAAPSPAKSAPSPPPAPPPPVGASLAPAPEPAPTPLDLGSLVAQYRIALYGAAKRQPLYPSRAITRGWEGRVEIRLVIGAGGELARAHVKRSSGHDLLDRHALDMFRAAHSLTPIPPALRGHEFPVEVAAVYELKDR